MSMGFAATWLRQVSPPLHKTTLTTGMSFRHEVTLTSFVVCSAFMVVDTVLCMDIVAVPVTFSALGSAVVRLLCMDMVVALAGMPSVVIVIVSVVLF